MPHTNVELEPVEEFLSKTVCVDRMALYTDCIDLFRNLQRASVLEDLNHIIFINDDLSPAEITDVIHQAMVSHTKAILAEFNVMTEGGSLPFLIKLTNVLNLIDAWDEPEHIINVATYAMGEPRHKLFKIINIVQDFDDEEYYQCVTMVSISLIEKIIELHNQRLEQIENDEIADDVDAATQLDFTILKKVVKGNRQLAVADMFAAGVISSALPAKHLVDIASPYLDSKEITEPKPMAAELIGIFLITGLTDEPLLECIKKHMPAILSDDLLISRTKIVLNTVYMELTA